MSKTVIVTGSQGFIGGYLCRELLDRGYEVVGIDNYSKYGRVKRDYDIHPRFFFMEYDISTDNGREYLIRGMFKFDPDYIIACAAMIGGISYFHKYAYDLLATNERIMANTFDAAIAAHKNPVKNSFKRIIVLSSSMVYEGADAADKNLFETSEFWPPWPTAEGAQAVFGPPDSTYGFQKLAAEYYCKGAWQQYKLPYTILRPFNCVGVGEDEAIGEAEVYSGNVKLRMSHVVPDIINKCLKGQNPLHLLGDGQQVRCYTHGKDIARGICMAMESRFAINEDFNISNPRATTVLELAKLIWRRINPNKPFKWVSDEPFSCDVQKRIPNVKKAKDLLGFSAQISLESSIEEVIESMKNENLCS